MTPKIIVTINKEIKSVLFFLRPKKPGIKNPIGLVKTKKSRDTIIT